MLSSLPGLVNPWVVGIATGLLVILAQWAIVFRVETRTWDKARNDFALRSLDFANLLTSAMVKKVMQSDEMVFLHDGLDEALMNVHLESERFAQFLNVYSRALPAEWAAKMSAVADEISIASGDAQAAAEAWPRLNRSESRDDHRHDSHTFMVGQIGLIAEDELVFTGTPEEIEWKRFGQSLFKCCTRLATTADSLRNFYKDCTKPTAIRRQKQARKDNDILIGQVAKNGRCLRDCADLMGKKRLNTLALRASNRAA